MKTIISKPVNYNGNSTTLNFIEAPKSGKINMPKNDLGYYVGTDGQLYKPVITFGKTYMDKETLRDFVWHAIRNIQRHYNGKNRDVCMMWTRTYYQMHTLLVGDDKYDEKLVKAICELEGLELLLEVKQEDLPPYKAHPKEGLTVWVYGKEIDRLDLVCALRDAGSWYNWESKQPDQKYREGFLLYSAISALYPSFLLNFVGKRYIQNSIALSINNGRGEEEEIPMAVIKKMMKACEIPVSKKKQCA